MCGRNLADGQGIVEWSRRESNPRPLECHASSGGASPCFTVRERAKSQPCERPEKIVAEGRARPDPHSTRTASHSTLCRSLGRSMRHAAPRRRRSVRARIWLRRDGGPVAMKGPARRVQPSDPSTSGLNGSYALKGMGHHWPYAAARPAPEGVAPRRYPARGNHATPK